MSLLICLGGVGGMGSWGDSEPVVVEPSSPLTTTGSESLSCTMMGCWDDMKNSIYI